MNKSRRTLVSVLMILLLPTVVLAQYTETNLLAPTDAVAQEKFGNAVACDGSLVVVGSRFDGDNGLNSGSAYLYADTGQRLHKLLPLDGDADDEFGYSVAIAGNRVLVGAMMDEADGTYTGAGSAYLFDTVTGNQLLKLVPDDGWGSQNFGSSVAISGDYAIVGVGGNYVGAVYVFDLVTGAQLRKLTPSDPANLGAFGTHLAAHGSYAVIGALHAYNTGNDAGAAYLFDLDTGTEIRQYLPDVALGEDDFFGCSVALTDTRILVGAYGEDRDTGAAYLFDRATGNQLAKLQAYDAREWDEFGVSVAMDGQNILIGARGDDQWATTTGSVYAFDSLDGNPRPKVLPQDQADSGHYGGAVDLSGSLAVVGDHGNSANGTEAGAAYIYSADFDAPYCHDGTWQEGELCGRDAYLTTGEADLNHDCVVDFLDMGLFYHQYGDRSPELSADLNGDLHVNLIDLMEVARGIQNEVSVTPCTPIPPLPAGCEGTLALSLDPNQIVSTGNAQPGLISIYVLASGVTDARVLEFALQINNLSGDGLQYTNSSSSPLGWESMGSSNLDEYQCWTGETPANGTVAIAQFDFFTFDPNTVTQITLVPADWGAGRISWADSDFDQRMDFASTMNLALGWAEPEPGISTCVDPNQPPELSNVNIGDYVGSPPPTVPAATDEYPVYGSASDPDGSVDRVEVRLVGGDWQTATGTTMWYTYVDLLPGDNRIEVRAVDDEGATSPIHGGWVIREVETPPPSTTISGMVFADLDGNGEYDPGSEHVIPDADLLLDGEIAGTSDSLGEFSLEAPQAGPGHELLVSAAGYATAQLTGLTVPTADFPVSLAPLSAPRYGLWLIDTTGEPLSVETGGTAIRYFRVVDENTGLPLGNVEVGVQTPDKSEQLFTSRPDGIVACEIPQSLIGPPGTMQTLAAVSVGGEELMSPAFYQCEIKPRPAETSFLSSGSVSGSAFSYTHTNGQRCAVTLVDDGEELGADLIRIQPGLYLDFGASAGPSVGFDLQVGGQEKVTVAAQAGASIEGKGYHSANALFEYPWPPASEQDAKEMYELIAFAHVDYLDALLGKALTNSVVGNPTEWTDPAWQQAEYGTALSQQLISQVNFESESTNVGLSMGASVEASQRAYFSARHYDGDGVRILAGLKAFGDWSTSTFMQIPEPGQGDTTPGSSRFVRSVGQVNESGFGFNVESWVERPGWDLFPSEAGFRTSVFGAGDGAKNTHEYYFVRYDEGLQELFNIDQEGLFPDLWQVPSGIVTLDLDSDEMWKSMLQSFRLFNGYQETYPDGPHTADEGRTLLYEREIEELEAEDSDNWSLDLKLNFLGFGAEIHTYAHRLIAHRNLVEKGEWRGLEKLPEVEYPEETQPATSLTYKQVLQVILDNLSPEILEGVDREEFLSTAKAPADSIFTLQDGLSTLTVNPVNLPVGASETYWTWTSSDPTKGPLTPRQEVILRKMRARLEESHGMRYGIGGFHQFEPDGEVLGGPATLSVAYADSEVVGFDESQLAIYYEDKANHRYVYLGGAVDTLTNTVQVPISELRQYTIGPRLPTGDFALTPDLTNIPADGMSTTLVSSPPLMNNDGSPVPDGALFTVTTSNGTITDTDLDTELDGRQVAVSGGVLVFNLQASHLSGPAVVQARSVAGYSAAADTLAFTDLSIPTPPSNLRVTRRGMNSLGIAWDQSPSHDVAGYRIYFDTDSDEPPYDGLVSYGGLPSPFDVAQDTAVTIVGLELLTDYYVTVTAYDVAGKESVYPATLLTAATTTTQEEMPALKTDLGQNVPNPFNPLTTIAFTLPRDSHVSLKIFDVRGRLVKTLIDERVPSGSHTVKWQGDDRHGRQVSSGVYLYLLQTEHESRTRKMVVVR